MKKSDLFALVLLVASLLLSSCNIVYNLWWRAYEHRGGYHDKPQPSKQ